MTTPHRPRSIAFLVASDRPKLLSFIVSEFHTRRRGRDHQGEPAGCHRCSELVDSLMLEVGARCPNEGWACIDEVVRDLGRRDALRKSMLIDAERRFLATIGLRPRPDRDARWFRPILDQGAASGSLTPSARIAEKLIEWAIAFGQDLDQAPQQGAALPFDRLAPSIAKKFGIACTSAQVHGWWQQIVHLCDADPVARPRLDALVLSRGDHDEQVGLERVTSTGAAVPSEESGTVLPLWQSSAAAGTDRLVVTATAEMITWMSSLGRKPSAGARRRAAADAVRSGMERLHPEIVSTSGAHRVLTESEPAFAELIEQVLAESDAGHVRTSSVMV